MNPDEHKAIIERGTEIQWLKFAEHLRENYGYLLNLNLCLRIAEDAKEFASNETSEVRANG